MKIYLITYDLNKKDKNYEGVMEAIKRASANNVWCKPLKSTFLIQSNLSVNEISDMIQNEADSNDFWLVIEVQNNKQGWLTKDQWDYINKMF